MRPRTKDRHLPACVYQKHGAFWYVKGGKWRKIGTDLQSALMEYARIVSVPKEGLPALIDAALPHLIKDVSPATERLYRPAAATLKNVFANFHPDQVKHGHVVEMMDAYSHQYGRANRLLTVLNLTFQWALDRGKVESNPCVSVKRFTTRSRDRLLSHEEYDAIHKASQLWMQCIMDICYLTAQRIGDVLEIEEEHILERGIYFQQQKTGKQLIVGWTPELAAAVERARGIVGNKRYLLGSRDDKPRAHTNVWREFKRAAAKAKVPDATLHDIRAMAGTHADAQGVDPMALLGHSDRRTTEIYLRDKRVKVVKGPSKDKA
ncbi:tyrosine-type recombinase/integrase [Achromobacter anxifer]|uniref:tyrosine-type recombinase/integrase n=1 Tax=Achromobacter anxifer TaxID=1287737 RepID=UPI0023F81B46|nr:tyrosine-type recombinase/integrase [Achromobacter anxifer]MDF8361187.1 tyrosine-type recombinase/integrase [Achromobacter anxifer]